MATPANIEELLSPDDLAFYKEMQAYGQKYADEFIKNKMKKMSF